VVSLNIKKLLYKFTVLLFILSLTGFTACSAQKKPDMQNTQNKAEEKKPPEDLDKLKDSIKKVDKALKAIYEESKKPIFIQEEKISRRAGRPVQRSRRNGRRKKQRRGQQRRARAAANTKAHTGAG